MRFWRSWLCSGSIRIVTPPFVVVLHFSMVVLSMTQKHSVDQQALVDGFADRLRASIGGNGLTIQGLADKTGIPKRTIENYLRSKDPQLPSVEAAAKLSIGLGVSLDWLLLNSNAFADNAGRAVKLWATVAAKSYLEDMLKYHRQGSAVFSGETILGFTPDALAKAIGENAASRARAINEMGGGYDAMKTAEAVFSSMSDDT